MRNIAADMKARNYAGGWVACDAVAVAVAVEGAALLEAQDVFVHIETTGVQARTQRTSPQRCPNVLPPGRGAGVHAPAHHPPAADPPPRLQSPLPKPQPKNACKKQTRGMSLFDPHGYMKQPPNTRLVRRVCMETFKRLLTAGLAAAPVAGGAPREAVAMR
jgi:hypothetical protein